MGNTIKELPENLRPYEKAKLSGPGALDDAELLAVVLRTGTRGVNSLEMARLLLKKGGGTLAGVKSLSQQDLRSVPGIGEVKALELQCLSELAVRFSKSEQAPGLDFSSPEKIAWFYMEEMRGLRQEELRALFLNTKAKLISEETVSRGTVNTSVFPVREILVSALRNGAVNLILIHNHPSGDPSPSGEDIEGTRQMKAAAELSGISLLDHVIIGNRRYVSLRERGLLP